MTKRLLAVIAWVLLQGLVQSLGLGLAHAQETDPALQAREMRLAGQLRCVVCQNQTVAESNAPLAADMRRVIRTQLQAGRTDTEIVDFFEQRYGAFVHYSPPFQASTWLLWVGPFALAAIGLLGLFTVLRRRMAREEPTPLTEAQRARALRLLDEESKP
ncbi:MAG: cytochrome c-type biogenesis protein CcmH [Comamonadaceae bacterium]|nr:MAG: cytochrome c-type biogenesis protein CcmH [Comamonadaceae bacterium]